MNAAQNGVKDSSSVDTWEVRAPEKGQLYFTHPHVFQTLISLLSYMNLTDLVLKFSSLTVEAVNSSQTGRLSVNSLNLTCYSHKAFI